jgi:hypothetical protein
MGLAVDRPNISAGAGVPCKCMFESKITALDPSFRAGYIRASCRPQLVLMNSIENTEFFNS